MLKSLPGQDGRITVNGRYVGTWQWGDKQNPIFAKLKDAYDSSLNVAREFGKRRQDLQSNEHLTDTGRKFELEKWARASALGPLAKARKLAIPAAKREIEARTNRLHVEGPDKSDLAGAVMRGEIRTWLRGLPAKGRSAVLDADADPLIALAIVEGPAALSGVSPSRHARLVEKAIDALHPGEREEVAELQKAVETVERMVSAAEVSMQSEFALTTRAFQSWLDGAPLEGVSRTFLKQRDGHVYAFTRGADGQVKQEIASVDQITVGIWIKDDDPSTHIPKDWLGKPGDVLLSAA
ncbi:hypothetical protein [Hyphomicrobium sp. D-2]|uniref:hypothetical protein n=1 Tax=Hyphomicrobium sp. D-2 TaxID=3041621 RepID=UPI002457052F|nr:hypothetical protein [Hyphomicrobium sp. D-2]MDH4981243.1 hypothetical protein [Hyphomicrobium sp. D-2]